MAPEFVGCFTERIPLSPLHRSPVGVTPIHSELIEMQNRGELGKLAAALEGIPVWGCLAGSVAQTAGIQYGDVVLAVNGKRTKDLDDYVEARGLRNDGAEVVVFRNGVEQTIDLIFRPPTEAPDRLVQSLVQQVVEGRILPFDVDVAKAEPGTTH